MDIDSSGAGPAAGTRVPGWYADPADPSRQLYWDGRAWVPDSTPPVLAAAPATGPIPPLGTTPPPSAPTGPPIFGLGAAAPVAPTPTGPVQSPARAAAPSFLLGAAVAIVVSALGIAMVTSHSSGIIWFGAYFVTASAWRRSWLHYTTAKRRTGQGLGGPATAAVVVLAGAAVVLTAIFAVDFIGEKTAPKLTAKVGSCWSHEGENVRVVDCGDSAATLSAISTAASTAGCPATAEGSVNVDGVIYCLQRR